MRVGKVEASNWVMGPMPLLPPTMPRQDSSTPVPTGQTIPSPVTTTRRLDMMLTSSSQLRDGGWTKEGFARPDHRLVGRRDRTPATAYFLCVLM